jgi:formiminoglutamase
VHQDPFWPRASAWLAGESEPPTLGRVAVLGAPLNASVTPGRCDLAPAAIRGATARLSTFDPHSGLDARSLACTDLGDLPIAGMRPEMARGAISGAVADAVRQYDLIVVLGGDNGVTRPAVHGLAEALGVPLDRIGLLTLDAHLDMRTTADGLHNGNPVRALLDDGLPGENVCQVGIAAFANSRRYFQDAKRAGVRVVTAQECRSLGVAESVAEALDRLATRVSAIHVDVDVDVLDRAFAPACPGSRPAGWSPHELNEAVRLCGFHLMVKSLDIVEVDPEKDIAEATQIVAAQALLSAALGVAERLGARR